MNSHTDRRNQPGSFDPVGLRAYRLRGQARSPTADRPSQARTKLAGSGTSVTGGGGSPDPSTVTLAPSRPCVSGRGGMNNPTATVYWLPPRVIDLLVSPR